jgi:hypothetical protein
MKTILALIIFLFINSYALAKSAPDTVVDGDQHRNLNSALSDMGAASINIPGLPGGYKGLYNVHCRKIYGAFRFCTASASQSGEPQSIMNQSSAAIVMGEVFAATIGGGANAFSVKADLVACNHFYDGDCIIKGIQIEEPKL